MTEININNSGSVNGGPIKAFVGDVFLIDGSLYMVVDVENNTDSRFQYDLINLQTGLGVYNNNDGLNLVIEEHDTLRELSTQLQEDYSNRAQRVDKIDIKFTL